MTERAAVSDDFFNEFAKWVLETKEEKEKEDTNGGPYHTALATIDKALAATISHMKAQRDDVEPKTTRDQLAEMWQAASRSLRGLDNNFATVCQYKGLGWIDEVAWDRADQRGMRTDIEYIQDKRDELSRTPDPDAPKGIFTYIGTEERRKRLAFIGAGLAAVIGAGWAVFIHLNPEEKKPTPGITINNTNTNNNTVSPTMNQNVTVSPPTNPLLTVKASFDICTGEHWSSMKQCVAAGARRVPCGTDIADYIKSECEKFEFKRTYDTPGGQCGYSIYHVECTAIKQ